MRKEMRNFTETNSMLYSEIVKCNSHMNDIETEARIEIAKSFLKDLNLQHKKGYKCKVVSIEGSGSRCLLDILQIQSLSNIQNIKERLADIIINDNINDISALMLNQLYRYTARASGVNEKIFYGE